MTGKFEIITHSRSIGGKRKCESEDKNIESREYRETCYCTLSIGTTRKIIVMLLCVLVGAEDKTIINVKLFCFLFIATRVTRPYINKL